MILPPKPEFINLINDQNEPIDLWKNKGVPDLPKGLLPKVIETYAFEVAKYMGTDPSALAMSALTVASAAIPDYINLLVKPNDPTKWTESPRIWTLLIGQPSAKKSPIIKSALSPLASIDYRHVKNGIQAQSRWAALSKEEKKLTPEPHIKRLRIEDITPEAAQEVLKHNHNGVLCVRDEASGWFGQMEKYNSARSASADRAFWLHAYNGGYYCSDRIGRGFTMIPNLSISFLGGIQPGPLASVAASAADDGLLQRMIPITMRSSTIGVDDIPSNAQISYDLHIEFLAMLQPMGTLRFDPKAQQLRNLCEAQYNQLEKTETINPKFATHIGKLHGLFPRLCIVWHAIENHLNIPPVIAYETAQRVAKFIEDFIIPHIACFYSAVGLSEDHDIVKKVAEHILCKKLVMVTARDIYKSTATLKKLDTPTVLKVFQQLIALGWLSESPQTRRGTSDPAFIVNPRVHALFAEKGQLERLRRYEVQSLMAKYFN